MPPLTPPLSQRERELKSSNDEETFDNSTISRIERNQSYTRKSLEIIAQALGVPLPALHCPPEYVAEYLHKLNVVPHHRFWAIVPAAGVGKRMGADAPKQYLDVKGKPVLQHTLERLLSVEALAGIVVALGAEDGYWPDLPSATHPKIRTAPGGKERADSVLSALRSLTGIANPDDWVLVHDAARLCITHGDVEKLIESLKDDPVGGILALPVSDTLKGVAAGEIVETVDRSRIWRALTPQMFRYAGLKHALEDAAERRLTVTDEASALELQGLRPKIVEGRPDNIKITRPEDLPLATFYLERQCFE